MLKILLVIVALVVISPIMTKLLGNATLALSSKPNFFGKRILQLLLDIPFIVFCVIMLYCECFVETIKNFVNKK